MRKRAASRRRSALLSVLSASALPRPGHLAQDVVERRLGVRQRERVLEDGELLVSDHAVGAGQGHRHVPSAQRAVPQHRDGLVDAEAEEVSDLGDAGAARVAVEGVVVEQGRAAVVKVGHLAPITAGADARQAGDGGSNQEATERGIPAGVVRTHGLLPRAEVGLHGVPREEAPTAEAGDVATLPHAVEGALVLELPAVRRLPEPVLAPELAQGGDVRLRIRHVVQQHVVAAALVIRQRQERAAGTAAGAHDPARAQQAVVL
mmetsp:Transcript_8663/g.22276  ORF Transcript_8663/g.22276 Transcript_8663/m.22276 type:complete len:262 (-) Transcript_8663:296-1081(-)